MNSPATRPVSTWIGEFILLAALWGASFLFMRLGASDFGPLPTAGLRVALATVFLWPIMLRQGHWPALRAHWRPILFAGVINSAIPFSLFSWAVLHIATGLTSILNATVPLFGALIARVWLGDRINRLRWVGLALGFVGVALLAWRAPAGTGFKTDHAHWAIAACLLASAFYGVSASFARRHLTGLPPLATAAGSQLGAALDHMQAQVESVADGGGVFAACQVARFEQALQARMVLRIQAHQPAEAAEPGQLDATGEHGIHGPILHARRAPRQH